MGASAVSSEILSAGSRLNDDIDHAFDVEYQPLASFVDQPPPGDLKPCSEYVLSDCSIAMPECIKLQESVTEVSRIVSSKLGDPSIKKLLDSASVTPAMFFAI